mmetsp:Transcript_5462/g.18816  ORF Transcript_5462/g.18816 Transcript_5462/m.18816 type:complete len:204 (-) Transcript_5462:1695-2306(-)
MKRTSRFAIAAARSVPVVVNNSTVFRSGAGSWPATLTPTQTRRRQHRAARAFDIALTSVSCPAPGLPHQKTCVGSSDCRRSLRLDSKVVRSEFLRSKVSDAEVALELLFGEGRGEVAERVKKVLEAHLHLDVGRLLPGRALEHALSRAHPCIRAQRVQVRAGEPCWAPRCDVVEGCIFTEPELARERLEYAGSAIDAFVNADV